MKWNIVFTDGAEIYIHDKEMLMIYLNTYSDEELELVDRIERVKERKNEDGKS